MKAIAIHDAKTNLSKYIAAAKRGEKVYIGNRGKAEVVLTVIDNSDKPKRKLGVAKGKIWIAPDFDEIDELTQMMIDGPLSNEK